MKKNFVELKAQMNAQIKSYKMQVFQSLQGYPFCMEDVSTDTDVIINIVSDINNPSTKEATLTNLNKMSSNLPDELHYKLLGIQADFFHN